MDKVGSAVVQSIGLWAMLGKVNVARLMSHS
jgi:hypothetical protein